MCFRELSDGLRPCAGPSVAVFSGSDCACAEVVWFCDGEPVSGCAGHGEQSEGRLFSFKKSLLPSFFLFFFFSKKYLLIVTVSLLLMFTRNTHTSGKIDSFDASCLSSKKTSLYFVVFLFDSLDSITLLSDAVFFFPLFVSLSQIPRNLATAQRAVRLKTLKTTKQKRNYHDFFSSVERLTLARAHCVLIFFFEISGGK